jgi:C-terminal processing protease CtpA/Prc
LINGNIGYISIPEFAGNDKLAHEYALELQSIITAFDKHSIKGWIIDLQENRGGNMWPMILGLGPLFEKDTLGYFVDPHNSYFEWIYSKGTVSIGKAEIMKLKDFHLLQNKNKKKAVLIGVKTASSGEATAIAFKGSANTKFFGHATRGLSTGNQGYSLSDGATLILTTSTFVDKNKKVYGHAIEPELYGSNAREEAVNWIKNE